MLMKYTVLQFEDIQISQRTLHWLTTCERYMVKANLLSDRIIEVLKSMHYESHMKDSEKETELHKHCPCVVLLPADRFNYQKPEQEWRRISLT